jgi:hypothetical protein
VDEKNLDSVPLSDFARKLTVILVDGPIIMARNISQLRIMNVQHFKGGFTI